jgi:hypothetical protein
LRVHRSMFHRIRRSSAKCRNKPCADSESQFFAIKKFFTLTGLASRWRASKRVFCANRVRLIRNPWFCKGSVIAAYGESLMHARRFETHSERCAVRRLSMKP